MIASGSANLVPKSAVRARARVRARALQILVSNSQQFDLIWDLFGDRSGFTWGLAQAADAGEPEDKELPRVDAWR